jgi:hypothetical protein
MDEIGKGTHLWFEKFIVRQLDYAIATEVKTWYLIMAQQKIIYMCILYQFLKRYESSDCY